ncbi:MAG TPA: lamin tail domain-containing protein, partial [Gaiellaceae bacterium]|nr:lamin tail domain-containing protein [Gaiellaceae bacterium]
MRRSFVAAVAVVFLLAGGQAAQAASPNLVLSQIYGGGGNASAQYTHDLIEIFNRGTTSVSLAGLSLQYASATGTGNLGANSSQLTELTGGTLAPGQYFLVQEASGTSPAPGPNFVADVIDATPINMAAGGGKVALVTGTTSLGCNGGSAPCSAAALARIIDLIGYDGANFFEGASAAPTLSN